MSTFLFPHGETTELHPALSKEGIHDAALKIRGCGFYESAERELQAFVNRAVEECYMAARGNCQGGSQLYWKGRSEAATDVRALKVTK